MNNVIVSPETIHFVDPHLKSRLGLIALATDLTTEDDYSKIIPSNRATVYTTRVEFQNPTTPENLRLMAPRLTAAAQLLKSVGPLDAICYSCTAASVVIGDKEVRKAIHAALPEVPVVTPSGASLKAFKALGINRISILTPYLVETTQPLAAYFSNNGMEIQKVHCLEIDDDRIMARVSHDSIISAALATDTPQTEGFFLSCTGLPAVGVIATIEKITGKPVVTSNQATAWALLHHGRIEQDSSAYGKLFKHKLI